jgi:hypothetical protein
MDTSVGYNDPLEELLRAVRVYREPMNVTSQWLFPRHCHSHGSGCRPAADPYPSRNWMPNPPRG